MGRVWGSIGSEGAIRSRAPSRGFIPKAPWQWTLHNYCSCYYYYYQVPTGSRLHPRVGSRSTITRDGCDRGGCHLIRRLQDQTTVTVGVEGLEAGFHHSILIQSIVEGSEGD